MPMSTQHFWRWVPNASIQSLLKGAARNHWMVRQNGIIMRIYVRKWWVDFMEYEGELYQRNRPPTIKKRKGPQSGTFHCTSCGKIKELDRGTLVEIGDDFHHRFTYYVCTYCLNKKLIEATVKQFGHVRAYYDGKWTRLPGR